MATFSIGQKYWPKAAARPSPSGPRGARRSPSDAPSANRGRLTLRTSLRVPARAAMVGALAMVVVAFPFVSSAATLFSQGFEANTVGWDTQADPDYNAARVPSGTSGITSASGGYHA